MNKIVNYILIFFFIFLLNCSYEPILNKKIYKFSINLDELNGDKIVNSIIKNNFSNLGGNENTYDLVLSSNKEKNIISKNSKGDPAIYELIINVKYFVKKDGKTLLENEINRKTTYNNIEDKFELENYEKTIIDNLSTNISENIILSISNINE
tara:strand:- start:1040 stop:1498 length:459 start_codon:yes stop_codon:yes gene_type:complete